MSTISFKHHFLIAMPSLRDKNFSKSVIYLYEHTFEGAMGLVINKPLHINLASVLKHLKIKITEKSVEKQPVLMGGPVGQEHGFVLHESVEEKEITISASKEMLRSIAIGKGPKNYLVTLGYTGWGAKQLELEVNRNDWLIAPSNMDILFNTPLEKRWQEAAKLIGIDINRISDQIGHA